MVKKMERRIPGPEARRYHTIMGSLEEYVQAALSGYGYASGILEEVDPELATCMVEASDVLYERSREIYHASDETDSPEELSKLVDEMRMLVHPDTVAREMEQCKARRAKERR